MTGTSKSWAVWCHQSFKTLYKWHTSLHRLSPADQNFLRSFGNLLATTLHVDSSEKPRGFCWSCPMPSRSGSDKKMMYLQPYPTGKFLEKPERQASHRISLWHRWSFSMLYYSSFINLLEGGVDESLRILGATVPIIDKVTSLYIMVRSRRFSYDRRDCIS